MRLLDAVRRRRRTSQNGRGLTPDACLLLVAIALLFARSACDDRSTFPGAAAAANVRSVPSNPFTFDNCRLPHYCSPCGTHSPRYLDQEVAKRTIELAFRDAGYRLTLRYPFERDGITCVADGYDPVHRIGFIYAYYDNLDFGDAFTSIGGYDESYAIDCSLGNLANQAMDDRDESLLRAVETARKLTKLDDRILSLRRLASRDRPHRLSVAEAKRLIQRAEASGEFVAVVSHFDLRFDVDFWEDDFQNDSDVIDRIPDDVKRRHLSAIMRERMVRQTAEQLRQTVHDYIAWARSRGLR